MLPDDELFVLWYLQAQLVDDEQQARNCLTGIRNDRSADAVLIESEPKLVSIIQGKYRQGWGTRTEKREDVQSFAAIGRGLFGDTAAFTRFVEGMDPFVRDRLKEARRRIQSDGFKLELHYVTTGKCSDPVKRSAEDEIKSVASRQGRIEVITAARLGHILSDYTNGAAPPVRALDLSLESGNGVSETTVLHREDGRTQIESWVLSVNAQSIVDMYQKAGLRLFARNVRGFLGKSTINREMERTLKDAPQFFWYYNNGITVVCDEAELTRGGGQQVLRLSNPQIINGQQTTRTLAELSTRSPKASVLVRVIQVPRDTPQRGVQFERLVSNIVAATNWQNAILQSDLRSNDHRQIELQRNFRKLDYQYLRKRMSKSEARILGGGRRYKHQLKKEDVATAVGACDLDPSVVRVEGKEGLFDNEYYGKVFPSGDPFYYLPRYWLLRQISSASRGYPERGYAKWMVLNHLWERLSNTIGKGPLRRTFVKEAERGNRSDITPVMISLANTTFTAAGKFFAKERGTGPTKQDVSNFYRLRNLDSRFAKYLATAKGRRAKGSIDSKVRRFNRLLSKNE